MPTDHPSICRGCHGGCAAWVTVDGGKVVRVRPRAGSPFNLGRMCVKGLSAPAMMAHPDRLTVPLKRVGERGEGRFEPVSWDEALSAIAGRLDAFRRESGPHSVALGQGTGRPHYFHVIRFANTFGTPNWYEPGLANCFIPRITVANLTYGGFVVGDYTGEAPPRTILFWGHNPLVSGPDGELAFPIKKALAAGARGIAVDPRRSETAKRCDLWLPIRPGTDAALALGMARAIIEEGWYDREFVAAYTLGFDELRAAVAHCTPAWTEARTGVPAGLMLEAARRYALEKPSILDWGVSLEQNPNCLQTVRAVAVLRGLTGNLDIPGGDVFGTELIGAYPVLRQALPAEAQSKRLGAERFKLLGGFRAFMPSAHIPTLFGAMRTGQPYPVRALLLFGNNPLATVADSRLVLESLNALELLVVADHFLTPTAALADYVLPAAMWPEMDGVIELPLVAPRAVFAHRKLAQTGQCRQIEAMLDDLAVRLGLPGAGEPLHDIFDARLRPAGVSFAELAEGRMVMPPPTYRRYAEKGFRTPTRKVELFSKGLARLGYDPLPSYAPPPESPEASPETAREYPLILTTGARRAEFFHSDGRQISYLRARRPDPLVELGPATAAARGIVDGDWVRVKSPRGEVRMRARVTPDILEGVASLDHGWWFPERGPGNFGELESAANVLTSAGPPYDPAFGSYQLRGLLCEVEKE
ncbi:MAG: anaerobic dehydrogenase, typically selenocysteine-containing [Solidesulfovibrio magneticus str. Maddingley MBC34]|uniref:Anaerobic dehydrogenase, typically selenocysteine-containing n=1 Tax=Solidesulfovibrio magneticus str. Maddingley MBC34 TaxID=1206767 RepID=K6GCH4_9BACT|nr:MAG: anaerobic dehydrogenase, typically selenocysteine-containing [Solidesulfovibrio magneticus str. Maddingley MBC34]